MPRCRHTMVPWQHVLYIYGGDLDGGRSERAAGAVGPASAADLLPVQHRYLQHATFCFALLAPGQQLPHKKPSLIRPLPGGLLFACAVHATTSFADEARSVWRLDLQASRWQRGYAAG